MSDLDANLAQLLSAIEGGLREPTDVWALQYDLGLAWVHFPVGQGGLGVDPSHQAHVDASLARVGSQPSLLDNVIGVGLAAPTICTFGSDLQKSRWLRPAFTTEEIWCQLFSEPGAGSDLAGLSTRAERVGDNWVVNGQKVWTSFAHRARWGLLLARTHPDAPKHRGLTFFVVDMKGPGVEVRPLRQLTGDSEFNEVFFTDAVVPDSQRLGEVGQGWMVALTTLMNERTTLGGTELALDRGTIAGPAIKLWQQRGLTDPDLRSQLVDLWLDSEAHRALHARGQVRAESGNPGPESSVCKLVATELNQRVTEWAMDALGREALTYPPYDSPAPALPDGSADPRWGFLRARANTIEGGSTEVLLNTLAERVLGLPGDIRVDKDPPWSQVPRN